MYIEKMIGQQKNTMGKKKLKIEKVYEEGKERKGDRKKGSKKKKEETLTNIDTNLMKRSIT